MQDIEILYNRLETLKGKLEHALLNDYPFKVVNDLYLQVKKLESQIFLSTIQLN